MMLLRMLMTMTMISQEDNNNNKNHIHLRENCIKNGTELFGEGKFYIRGGCVKKSQTTITSHCCARVFSFREWEKTLLSRRALLSPCLCWPGARKVRRTMASLRTKDCTLIPFFRPSTSIAPRLMWNYEVASAREEAVDVCPHILDWNILKLFQSLWI